MKRLLHKVPGAAYPQWAAAEPMDVGNHRIIEIGFHVSRKIGYIYYSLNICVDIAAVIPAAQFFLERRKITEPTS